MLRGLGHLLEAVHVAVLLAHGMRDDQEGGALEEDHLVRVRVRVRVRDRVRIRVRVRVRVRVRARLSRRRR